jgi:hypothetical protein
MTIIGKATYGEKTYNVTLGTGTYCTDVYQVGAYNEQEAADKVADYLERMGYTNRYFEYGMLKVMAEYSSGTYATADEYADAHGLACCGNHGIYIHLVSVEEVQDA